MVNRGSVPESLGYAYRNVVATFIHLKSPAMEMTIGRPIITNHHCAAALRDSWDMRNRQSSINSMRHLNGAIASECPIPEIGR